MGGVPCIRGLRIPVATVVGLVADSMGDAEILAAYPDLEAEDIREASLPRSSSTVARFANRSSACSSGRRGKQRR